MATVDITGINKVVLLRLLWTSAKYNIAFTMTEAIVPVFDETSVDYATKHFVTKYSNKDLNVDISEDHANPYWYDFKNGVGAFEKVVQNIREEVSL